MEILELAELAGSAGLAAAVAVKGLEFAGTYLKTRYDKSKNNEPVEPAQGMTRAEYISLLSEMNSVDVKLTAVGNDLDRVCKAVLDGNGRPPLTETVVRIDQRLEDHVKDKGLHTQEK
jgi:hypothetical protein